MTQLRPLPDEDLERDLDIPDPRGHQHNQIDGPVNTVFPVVRGPQPRTKMRVLPENVVYPSKKVQGTIASLDANDNAIVQFDLEMSRAQTALQRLKAAALNLRNSTSRDNDTRGAGQEINDLVTSILIPWFLQIDNSFDKLLQQSNQGKEIKENLQP